MSLGKALLSVLFSLTITCMAKIGCLKKPVLNIFWLSVIEIKAGLFMMIITCSSARQHRLLTQSTLTSCMSTIFISLTTRIQNKLNNMNESLNVFFNNVSIMFWPAQKLKITVYQYVYVHWHIQADNYQWSILKNVWPWYLNGMTYMMVKNIGD